MSGWCCPSNTNKQGIPSLLSVWACGGKWRSCAVVCRGRPLWAQAGSVAWLWAGVCYHCSLPLQSPLQICLQPLSGLGAADKEGGE